MGNTPISVGLRTDQSSYTAGDTVTGRVYVLITKEAQPVQALVLQLRGEEHAVVNNTTGDDRRRNRREFTFLRMEYPLHTYHSDQQQQQHQQHSMRSSRCTISATNSINNTTTAAASTTPPAPDMVSLSAETSTLSTATSQADRQLSGA